MKSALPRLSLASLALCAGNALAADDVGAYLGVRGGSAMEDRYGEFTPELDADNPLSVYGGWNFSALWGLELGYIDLGETTAPNIADAGLDADGHLVTGGVSFRAPVAERFDVFAGAGLFKLSEDGVTYTVAGPIPLDLDDDGVYVEVGGRFHFNDRVALRASYQWFDFEKGNDGTPWIGAELRF